MTNPSTDPHRWFVRHPLFWGIILIVVFAVLRFAQTVTWQSWFKTLDFQSSTKFSIFILVWFLILSIGLIVGGLVWVPRISWEQLGWSWKGLPKAIGFGLLDFVLLTINIIVWGMVKGSSEQPQLIMPGLSRLLIVAFFAFGQPAWVEENLYRGYFQPLLSRHMNLRLAIILQAVIFSAAHLGYLSNPYDFGSSFVAGLILGVLRGRESNLVGPFLAHGLFWMMTAFMPIA